MHHITAHAFSTYRNMLTVRKGTKMNKLSPLIGGKKS